MYQDRVRVAQLALLLLVCLLLLPAVITYSQDPAADEQAEPESPAGDDTAPVWFEVLRDIGKADSLLHKLSAIVFILLFAALIHWLIMLVIRKTVARLEADTLGAPPRRRLSGQRAVTVLGLLANLVKWIIGVGVVLWVLSVLNVNLAPVLAGAGILGVAVGFGSQALVRDLITGFFLLLEGQYVVGDYIEVAGKFGLVESIGLRVTVLKDLDNQLHYIPNGSITQLTVYEEQFVNYIAEVPFATADEAERARGILQAVVSDMGHDYPRHLPFIGAAKAHASPAGTAACVRIPLAVFPTQDWLALDELPARVKMALAANGMSLPDGRAPRAYPDLRRMPLPRPPEDIELGRKTLTRLL